MAYVTASRAENSNIVILKERTFLSDSLDEFKHKLEEFQIKGIIMIDCNFEADHWVLSNGLTCANLNFKINEVLWKKRQKIEPVDFTSEELLNALRCFVLLHLENTVVKAVGLIFHGILRLLEYTCFLANNGEVIREFKAICKSQNLVSLAREADKLIEFINYFELLPMDERYYQIIQELIDERIIYQRALPMYASMFKLDRIISRFIDDSKSDEEIAKLRNKYYVIILWWLITTS